MNWESASIAPNGRRVAYIEARKSTEPNAETHETPWVFVSDSHGVSRAVAPVADWAKPVVWSSDGTSLFEADGTNIVRIDVRSGTQVVVDRTACPDEGEYQFSFQDPVVASRAGSTQIAYSKCIARSPGTIHVSIIVRDVVTGRVVARRSMPKSSFPEQMTWVPDGTALTYRLWDDAESVVRTLNMRTRSLRVGTFTTFHGIEEVDWLAWRPCPSRARTCMRSIRPSCFGLDRARIPTITRCRMRSDGSVAIVLRPTRENESNPTIIGTTRGDDIRGSNDTDIIHGEEGNDHIVAGAGDDVIYGGSGSDTIDSGAGADQIDVRGHDRDIVDCGPGRDLVLADSHDVLVGCENVDRYDPYVRTRGRHTSG
jgi:hypothetical protein